MRNRLTSAMSAFVMLLGVLVAASPAQAGAAPIFAASAAKEGQTVVSPDGKAHVVKPTLKGDTSKRQAVTTPEERKAGKVGARLAGNVYRYAGLYVYPSSSPALPDGATVRFRPFNPTIPSGNHTLFELAAESADSQQTVEVGCRKTASDTVPKLFVYHWINDIGQGYGTGFTPVTNADSIVVGENCPTTGTDLRKIVLFFFDGVWWIGYDKAVDGSTEYFGYFHGNRWTTATPPVTFNRVGLAQSFGEVNVPDTLTAPSCPQMGNGQYGRNTATPPVTNTSAAYMNSFGVADNGIYRTTVGLLNEPTPTLYRFGFQSGSSRSGYYGGQPTSGSC